MSAYAIRFDYPEAVPLVGRGPLYAGVHKGAWGWAPTLTTAELFETADAAAKTLQNAYGEENRKYGQVVKIADGLTRCDVCDHLETECTCGLAFTAGAIRQVPGLDPGCPEHREAQ